MSKRLFISFAVEDSYARDFLVGQSRNDACPFEFVDMSVKEPWDEAWKSKCRSKIRGCHGLIALLSKSTWNAGGARWEIKCAIEESRPCLGIHIQRDDKGAVPLELGASRIIEWNWDDIAAFIRGL